MKGWMAMAGVAVASVGLTAAVMAGGMHHAGMHHGTMHAQKGGGEALDWFVKGALDDLDVTEAQRAKVLAVKDRMAATAVIWLMEDNSQSSTLHSEGSQA